jgi:hypothetical protein
MANFWGSRQTRRSGSRSFDVLDVTKNSEGLRYEVSGGKLIFTFSEGSIVKCIDPLYFNPSLFLWATPRTDPMLSTDLFIRIID